MKYVHNDLISDLELFRIPEAILMLAFKFDTDVVVRVTFDISCRLVLTWNERDLIWISSMGNHGAAGGILRRKAF